MSIKSLIPTWNKRGLQGHAYNNDNPFQMIQNEMNELFDSFFGDFSIKPFNEGLRNNYPQIDIKETDSEISIEAELPGLDEKDIKLTLSNNVLSISGEKRQDNEEKKSQYCHVERAYGTFRRDIPIYTEIQEDKIKASFKKGVLKIQLPKTKEGALVSRMIPVQTS